MSRLRAIAGLVVVLLLAGLGYTGYQLYLAPAPPTPTSAALTPAASDGPTVVTAEGIIVPARDATLAFRLAGRVETVHVKEGQAVEAGAALVKLESADLRAAVSQAEAAVAQAQAALAVAQAQLAQLLAGARPEEIAAAEAQYKAAQAAVGQAAAQRDQVKKGPTEDAIAAAEAHLAQMLARQKEAQNAYDRLIENKIFGWTEEQARFQLNAANEAVAAAQAALDQVRAGASAEAVRASNNAVGIAVYQRDAAQANLELLKAGPTEEQIAAARAQVDQGQAGLAAARAALSAAQVHLAQSILLAPFAGTVVSLNTEVGEVVAPSVPVLVLADFSRWRMKTTDLSETDVVLVRPGQPSSVTLDALADQAFRGTVTDISSLAETTRGNTTYAVTISLDATDAPLRWGMTAFVDIQVQR